MHNGDDKCHATLLLYGALTRGVGVGMISYLIAVIFFF